jgi:hypothetical protein
MLGSISPVGEASRGQRWWLTATAYTVASLLAGAATGLLFGLVGSGLFRVVPTPTPVRLGGLAVLLAVGALWDTQRLPWRLPSWRRQVDERWLTTYRGWIYGAGFGFQLGTGLVTIVPSAVTYVMWVAALLTASVPGGLAVGVVFGLVRSIPLLLTAGLRSAAALHATTRRITDAEPAARSLTILGQVGTAAVALIAAVNLL